MRAVLALLAPKGGGITTEQQSDVFSRAEGKTAYFVLCGQWEAPIEVSRFLSCCLLSSWNTPCQAGLPGNAVNAVHAVLSPGIWSQLFNKTLQGSHCWLNGLSKITWPCLPGCRCFLRAALDFGQADLMEAAFSFGELHPGFRAVLSVGLQPHTMLGSHVASHCAPLAPAEL